MQTLYIVIFVLLLIAVISVAGTAYAKRRLHNDLFSKRELLEIEDIYESHYKGHDRKKFILLWEDLARHLRIPGGYIRPDDKLCGKEVFPMIPEKGNYGLGMPDEIEGLSDDMAKLLGASAKEIDFSRVITVDDFITTFIKYI